MVSWGWALWDGSLSGLSAGLKNLRMEGRHLFVPLCECGVIGSIGAFRALGAGSRPVIRFK